MSTDTRRSARQSASNTPSSSKAGNVFYVAETPTPAKRVRTTTSTPRGKTRRAATSATSTPRGSSPRKKSSRGGRNAARALGEHNGEDDDGDEDDGESSASDASLSGHRLISTLAKTVDTSTGRGFVHRNAFDAYFASASKPSRTSNNVFSELVPPLTQDEYTTLLANSAATSKNAVELEAVLKGHEKLFPRYAFELAEGFNLLFFGFGSKRKVLNTFARSVCAKRGHVVIINGYMPHVGIKELLARIEEVPGLATVPLPSCSTTLEAQTRRIYDFFLPPAVRPQHPTSSQPLFLIIHNIDSPALRTPKAKTPLSLLALNPRIHIAASIDHINAQMIWSTTEASTRKHVYLEELGDQASIPPTRGFAWAWHDMTTMQPYDAELAHVDPNIISNKGHKTALAERAMSESAAQHILASVNVKAKKLFVLLAKTLLASFEEAGGKGKEKEKQLQAHAVSYDALFNAARTDFIATNDTSFKALLAEFRDHKLVLTSVSGGGEALWIPLRSEELQRIIAGLVIEQ
ncbi:ORC2-domain-containing protein [Ramaria rubella]|nr:ORC2-domain-containing protein [Ramaria rubella]